ncbi:MAG: YecA family protein [Mariprofundus sp.]
MARKINRNEPCPCGSGKKYKKCCLLEERRLTTIRASNREVVQEAVNWIALQHGDAMAHWVEHVWFADIGEEERKGLSTADPAIRSIHDVNVLEQMVAEGVFGQADPASQASDDAVQQVPVLQLILDSAMDLTPEQRDYLQQLGQSPLRLYRVSECRPGEGFAVQRYPSADDAAVMIEDKWVSRMLEAGDTVGMRLMQAGGVWENSGAVYHIPDEYVEELLSRLEGADDNQYSRTLIHYWLGLVASHV